MSENDHHHSDYYFRLPSLKEVNKTVVELANNRIGDLLITAVGFSLKYQKQERAEVISSCYYIKLLH